MRVLVVDDDATNRLVLKAMLEKDGHSVLLAENGEQGVDLFDVACTDMVLMDVMMPVMDGYEATRIIRKQKRFKNLVIIALTAKAMKGDKEQCITAGANDYLTKPLQIDKLLSILQVWMYK
ncbi:MAG: response regulator [Gammaproteobacteria bacterium]|nr:response regulator [Gammaproteobacteria bacterium]